MQPSFQALFYLQILEVGNQFFKPQFYLANTFFVLLTGNVPVMLLQLEKVLEMHYLKIRNCPFCLNHGAPHRDSKETLKKLNLWGEMVVDKSAFDKRQVCLYLN